MESELLQRAQNVAALANSSRITDADVQEVNEVYFLLTGKKVKCKRCEVFRLINEIDRTINPKPKVIEMGKYQFKNAGTMIVRNTGTGFRQITAENLNKGDNAEWVMKRHAHLVEENPQFQAEAPAEVERLAIQKTESKQGEINLNVAPAKARKQGKKSHKK